MTLPAARVVRKAGVSVTIPPVPWAQRVAAVEEGLGPRTRAALAAVVGLWPVTAVVLLAFGLLWMSFLTS
jgi:hypothetical protein